MIPEGTRLFKVVGLNGEAVHGGAGTWSLPHDDQPGEWMPRVTGKIAACQRGYHLTPKPSDFYVAGARVFEAEWRAAKPTDVDRTHLDLKHSPKIAVREARLLREVEWGEFWVWFDGEHAVREGAALASGSATVEASGSATVRAYDSATVRAYDSATVRAYDSATVISTAYHSPSAIVALANLAAHVDRRGGKVELRKAAQS